MSMRVGMVCPYSLTLPGGVQQQVLALARTMRRQGVNVRVLGPCDGPPPDASVTPLGNSLPTAANSSMAPIAPDPAAQLRLIRALRDEEFDVLHVHEPLSPGVAMTALLVKPAPIVGTFHAAGGSLAYDYLQTGVRWLRTRIDHAVAVSEDARTMARDALGGDYEIAFNGVEVARYAEAEPYKREGPTVFFVGRHEERKGLSVLLEAMRDLPAEVRVWVAGDGPETDTLRASTAGDPRVEWLGRIDEAEKIARMKGADVLCAPSLRGESFGIVLLEAMAAGTPIVASRLPGYASVVAEAAEQVPPGDAPALSRALALVLGDAARSEALVVAGRERAEHFSMRRLADRYVEAYRSLV